MINITQEKNDFIFIDSIKMTDTNIIEFLKKVGLFFQNDSHSYNLRVIHNKEIMGKLPIAISMYDGNNLLQLNRAQIKSSYILTFQAETAELYASMITKTQVILLSDSYKPVHEGIIVIPVNQFFDFLKKNELQEKAQTIDTDFIWINPNAINLAMQEEYSIHKYKNETIDGDWHVNQPSFEDRIDFYQSLTDHIEKNLAWQDTTYYQRVMKEINSGQTKWHCSNEYEFKQRCLDLDNQYINMKNIGYCQDPNKDFVEINIGENGEIIFNNGRHRLCISKILNIPLIPVKVTVRHQKWVDFKKEIEGYANKNNGFVYAPLDHPDLSEFRYYHTGRIDEIVKHINSESKTVLDIGTHWGYMCSRLEEIGKECTAVEINKEPFYFLNKLKIANNKRYHTINQDIFSYTDSHHDFDTVLALNIFHHFIKTPELHQLLVKMLKSLNMKEMFFQAHRTDENQMQNVYKNYEPEEFVQFIIDHSCLTDYYFIESYNGRKMFKIFKQEKEIHTEPERNKDFSDLKVLFLSFLSTTHPQIMLKIDEQYQAMKLVNPLTECLVIGNSEKDYQNTFSFGFVDLDVNRLSRFEAADLAIQEMNPDVVYLRYPIANKDLLKLCTKYSNIVFEHQSMELPELEKGNQVLYKNEFECGNACIEKSLALVGVTDQIVNYELSRIHIKKPHLANPNGIYSSRYVIQPRKAFNGVIHALCIADFRYWHGLDRLIAGLKKYGASRDMVIHLVGFGPELETYKKMIEESHLSQYFVFEGKLNSEEILELSRLCHIGIGVLAAKRKGLTETCALKHREYFALGLPFVFAGKDTDFEKAQDYILQIHDDESPLDISDIEFLALRFIKDPTMTDKIRQYAKENLDWEIKAKILMEFLSQFNKKKTKSSTISSEKHDSKDNLLACSLFTQATTLLYEHKFKEATYTMKEYRAIVDYNTFKKKDNRPIRNPKVSIVVVCYNTNQLLLECLASLEKQNFDNFEVIVVNNGLNDAVVDELNALPLLHIQCPMNFILSEGRNIGVHFSKSEIIAFLDDDALVPENYVQSIIQAFSTLDIKALRGKVLQKTENQYGNYAKHYDFGNHPFPYYINTEGNSAFLKSSYCEFNGMNPLLFGGEGAELSYRLAKKYSNNCCIYWPYTIIYHDYAKNDTTLHTKLDRHELMSQYYHYLHTDFDNYLDFLKKKLKDYSQTQKGVKACSFKNEAMKELFINSISHGWVDRLKLYIPVITAVQTIRFISNPTISTIIITTNPSKDVEDCLLALIKENQQNEILLINNGADHSKFTTLTPLCHSFIDLNKNTGAYLSRNIGALMAHAPVLLFLDDDALPSEGLLEAHVELHKTHDIYVARGRILTKTAGTEKPAHYDLGNKIIPMFSDIEGNTSYKSGTFFKVGGWDDAIIMGGGGVDLSIRLFQIDSDYNKQIYSPNPLIYHDFKKDPVKQERKIKLQEESRKRLKLKHPNWDAYIQSWSKLDNPFINQDNQDNVKPFISICIPTYNRSRFLKEAINSALNQVYDNYEIVIVDDGSTDDTEPVVSSFNSEKIRYFKKNNEGRPKTRNFLIKQAKGDYLLWLDDDDLLSNLILFKYTQVLKNDPQIDIMYTDIEVFDQETKQIVNHYKAVDYTHDTSLILENLIIKSGITFPGSLIKKKLIVEAGCFDEQFLRAQDNELWTRLVINTRYYKFEEDLYQIRIHKDNVSSGENLSIDTSYEALVIKNIVKNYPLATVFPNIKFDSKDSKEQACFNIAKGLFRFSDCYNTLKILDTCHFHDFEPLLKLYAKALVGTRQYSQAIDCYEKLNHALNNTQYIKNISNVKIMSMIDDKISKDIDLNPEENTFIEQIIQNIGFYPAIYYVYLAEKTKDSITSLQYLIKAMVTNPQDQEIYDKALRVANILGKRSLVESALQRILVPVIFNQKKATSPLVSVILPTYNRPDRLLHALQSINNQSYDNIEVLVVNDGGISLADLINKTQKEFKIKINLIELEKNSDRCVARNTGIIKAQGQYISYLDDDDCYYPDHIDTLVKQLESSEYKVAYTDAFKAYKVKDLNGVYQTQKKECAFSVDFDKERLFIENYIPILCLMHRKECLIKIGLFDLEVKRTEDWDLWMRLALNYPFKHIKKTTCEFSWVDDGSNSMSSAKEPFIWSGFNMFYKYIDFAKNILNVKAKHDKNIAYYIRKISDNLNKAKQENRKDFWLDYKTDSVTHFIQRLTFLSEQYVQDKNKIIELIELAKSINSTPKKSDLNVVAVSSHTVEKNLNKWSKYNWDNQGDEWSTVWGSTENLWNNTILPRIKNAIPVNSILEIAPGFGRCTQFLLENCDQYVGIDLTPKCVEACKERFKHYNYARFYTNDGQSLEIVESNSIDFVFSWDSFVHIQAEVVRCYLQQISAKLKKGGCGFIHHSNIGFYMDSNGLLTVENKHWRAPNMSAELFRGFCLEFGLKCVSQEIIAWGGKILNDCFSYFYKPLSFDLDETIIFENVNFMKQISQPPIFDIDTIYPNRKKISSVITKATNQEKPFYSHRGYCPCCEQEVVFEAKDSWFRDSLKCSHCHSLPRERALLVTIQKYFPNWKELMIHESSPCAKRGASLKLKSAKHYLASQYFPDKPLGEVHLDFRNEDLEKQTIPDASFDLVITQDVMEHLFNPQKAFSEIARTLKNGGAHIFTVPLINKKEETEVWATLGENNEPVFKKTPEWHSNPINSKGSPVTMHWGFDIVDYIKKYSGLDTIIETIDNIDMGIRAEYIDVLVSKKTQMMMTPSLENETKSFKENTEQNKSASDIKYLAFYLPQFHPIPENDLWWGKGFTEWTNVTKAKPLFEGHYQPHKPDVLGYYDLRDSIAREKQAKLAKQYGIDGFIYYHYWFNGKRLLGTPIDEVLKSGKPDLPFCFCWANEDWTRAWDGKTGEILIGQNYCDEDDREHIRFLIKSFNDPRYIRIDDKPLFLVYRANKMPNSIRTTNIWREEAKLAGLKGLFLCRVESFSDEKNDPLEIGFDASIEFQPDWQNLSKVHYQVLENNTKAYLYNDVVDHMITKPEVTYKRFHGVTPCWDNSARRKANACILHDCQPRYFKKWLENATQKTMQNPNIREKLVFINAWNEWAEGNHLEPDQKYGTSYLESVLAVKKETSQQTLILEKPIVSIIIPVWNKVGFTKQCLDNVLTNTQDVPYEIIVVDNASTDHTLTVLNEFKKMHLLKQEDSDKRSLLNFRFIHNQENLGFSKANNQGAALAEGKYLVLLNNDTIPTKGWLSTMVNTLESDPKIGIVGVKLLYPNDSIQHCGVVMRRDRQFFKHPYKHVHKDHPIVNNLKQWDAVTAACLITRKKLYMENGGLDETFVNGCEDIDYCCFVRSKGFKILYQPKSVVYHFESQTPRISNNDEENFAYFISKWGNNSVKTEHEIFSEDGFWKLNGNTYIHQYNNYVIEWDNELKKAQDNDNKDELTRLNKLLKHLYTVPEWTITESFQPRPEDYHKVSSNTIANPQVIPLFQIEKSIIEQAQPIKKTKILFVCHDFPPYRYAGAQLYALNLAKEMNKTANLEVDIFHPVFREKDVKYGTIEKSSFEDLTVYKLYKPLQKRQYDCIKSELVEKAFDEFLTNNHYDIIHFHGLGQLSGSPVEVAFKHKIKTIMTFHDYWFICEEWHMVYPDQEICSGPESIGKCTDCLIKYHYEGNQDSKLKNSVLEYKELRRDYFLALFKSIDIKIAPSQYLKHKFEQYGFTNINVLPLGFISQEPVVKIKNEKIIFGYAGQIIKRKGIKTLIDAFQSIPKNCAELHIYGKFNENKFTSALFVEIASIENVKYFGAYVPEDLPKVFATFDIAVIPSLMENYPLLVQEAYLFKTPVIASRAGGIPESVKDDFNGLLFEAGNVLDLRSCLLRVCSDKTIIDQLTANISDVKSINTDILDYANLYGLNPKEIQIVKSSTKSLTIQFYVYKNVHWPMFENLYHYIKQQDKVKEIVICIPNILNLTQDLNYTDFNKIMALPERKIQNPRDAHADITFIADTIAGKVKDCGYIVNVGHGTISKGYYFTESIWTERENWVDLLCVPGPYAKNQFDQTLKTRVVSTGMPKLDPVFSGYYNRDYLCNLLNLDKKKKIVLYAPTFNKDLSSVFDFEERFNEFDSDLYYLLIKLHGSTLPYLCEHYNKVAKQSKQIIFIDDANLAPYLGGADIMISDVSSAFMEFMACNKPVILYNNPSVKNYHGYDPENIEYKWRELGTQVSSFDECKTQLHKILLNGDDGKSSLRKKYSELLFSDLKGQASSNVWNASLELISQNVKKKQTPVLSIVLILHNNDFFIRYLSYFIQFYSVLPIEIVLINYKSSDSEASIHSIFDYNEFYNVQIVDVNPSYSENIAIMEGFHKAQGEYIVYLRDDLKVFKNFGYIIYKTFILNKEIIAFTGITDIENSVTNYLQFLPKDEEMTLERFSYSVFNEYACKKVVRIKSQEIPIMLAIKKDYISSVTCHSYTDLIRLLNDQNLLMINPSLLVAPLIDETRDGLKYLWNMRKSLTNANIGKYLKDVFDIINNYSYSDFLGLLVKLLIKTKSHDKKDLIQVAYQSLFQRYYDIEYKKQLIQDFAEFPSFVTKLKDDIQLVNSFNKVAVIPKEKPKKKVMLYFFKNVHIPILKPILDQLKEYKNDIELAIGIMPYAPEIRAGFTDDELKIIHSYNLPTYFVPQDFNPDVTIIADSVYPWVKDCGKLIHIGHGILCKGQYYTNTEIAKREEQADLVCVPGLYHQEIMNRIISKPIVATGMAKLDALFDGTFTRESVCLANNLPQDYKYILYAPTFNDELSSIPFFKNQIHEIIPDNKTILLIKLHSSTNEEYKNMYREMIENYPQIAYIDDLDITPYLALANIMISDVSSAMIEFSSLGKSVILFNNPNWKMYKNYNPDDIEFKFRNIGYQVKSLSQVKDVIRDLYMGIDPLATQRKDITDLLLMNKKGYSATKTIVQEILSI